jgi:hypothetical protein
MSEESMEQEIGVKWRSQETNMLELLNEWDFLSSILLLTACLRG